LQLTLLKLLQGFPYRSRSTEVGLHTGSRQNTCGVGAKTSGNDRVHPRIGYYLGGLDARTGAYRSSLVVQDLKRLGCGVGDDKVSTSSKSRVNLRFQIGSFG
jgi:hypothetical protein